MARTVSVAIRMEDSLYKTFLDISKQDESSVAAVIRKYAKLGLAKEGVKTSSADKWQQVSDSGLPLENPWN